MSIDRDNGTMISRGSVKICGLREPEHAIVAAVAGADLLGFIFAPSRRYVTPAAAKEAIVAARSAVGRQFLTVGVFVNATAREMNAIAVEAGLDLIQLSGDESDEVIEAVDRPVLQGIRPMPGATIAELIPALDGDRSPNLAAHLVDGYHAGAFGGTGVRADWDLAASVARMVPVILAGGLVPENVAAAIASVRPWGVDVGSGVERDGVKDPERIVAFVQAAKAAFRSVG